MATTAREAMTAGAECVGEHETIAAAARKLADMGVGALPICGDDNRLKGMLTDRDIVVKVVAEGQDPEQVTAGSLGEGKPVTIDADDSLDEALRTMSHYKVRRLPVIDDHEIIGVLSQADLARALPPEKAGELVQAISSD